VAVRRRWLRRPVRRRSLIDDRCGGAARTDPGPGAAASLRLNARAAAVLLGSLWAALR